MVEFVVYGTEFEEPDDQEATTSRCPLRIHEQTVRDERGRQRFHGAFTGGFSAGYFNTVGSKEGWVPRQFQSSRENRWEKEEYKPEDFMDEEDLGEFGIATRKLRTLDDAGGKFGKQNFAWERGNESLKRSIASKLEALIQPVSDSFGIRLLKQMGWREGRGIGASITQRRHESKGSTSAKSIESIKEHEINAVDITLQYLKSRTNMHGLGYAPLAKTSILSEDYGKIESALKLKPKSKGIRGQAFGIGAFENGDEIIYSDYDLSQYDFALDPAQPTSEQNFHDTSFVTAQKRQSVRQFFEAPRIPHNFQPVHKPILPEIPVMLSTLRKYGEKMTHAQRAKFLGEVDKSMILELIKDQDRKKIGNFSSSGAKKFDENIFSDEPMKQSRFKLFLNYLKRGLNFPQPSEMTSLEWERELNEFHSVLPPHLSSLLPRAQRSQMPLAKTDIAIPIGQILRNKFVSSSSNEMKTRKEIKDEDRLIAIRSKTFGQLTRNSHEWYPAKNLAKLFNVPDPYPSSRIVGVPDLQKVTKGETLFNLGSTAEELLFRDKIKERNLAEVPKKELEKIAKKESEKEEKLEERPSEDFLKAIFGASDSEDEDETATEDKNEREEPVNPSTSTVKPIEVIKEKKQSPEPPENFVTVMDIALMDEEEYGPRLPPSFSNEIVSRRFIEEEKGVEKKERTSRYHSKEKSRKSHRRHHRKRS